ncbi:MAG TPA: hypothetical protein VFM70_00100 [Salinimicrobium sp.]|nr:hypothetical protein [Salinimicrobium sp.]
MKILLLILFLSFTQLASAQTEFLVANFSEDYYGKVVINDTSKVFSEGSITIYDTKTDKKRIRVDSKELALSLHSGEVLANIVSLPDGEQSVIIYDDFNFDGKKDFAIEDGQNSCYRGPSFKIFLAEKNSFNLNLPFTRLAQEYCGMFQIDSNKKKIYTMTKSGCCWHEFSEFIVENNKPKAIKIVTTEKDFAFNILTEQTWNGEKMIEKKTRTIDMDREGIEKILSFTIPENDTKMILYNINNRTLNYALVKKDQTVEFFFPIETIYKNPDFKFQKKNNSCFLDFINKNTSYKIYERDDELGIEIKSDGQIYNFAGSTKTKDGSLNSLSKINLDNVVFQD